MELSRVYHHKENMVCRKIGKELVIVPLRNNVADMDNIYTLNETGAFIWDDIDGKKSVKDIIIDIMENFETDEITAEKDVIELLEKMDGAVIL